MDNASNNSSRMKMGSYAWLLGTTLIAIAFSIIAISLMMTIEQAEELALAVLLSMSILIITRSPEISKTLLRPF